MVHIKRNLRDIAVMAAVDVGLPAGPSEAALFDALYLARQPRYAELNQARHLGEIRLFWRDLTELWLERSGFPPDAAEAVEQRFDELVFGSLSEMFELFGDVVACLTRLQAAGHQLAVVSNWDYSLSRVLETFGVRSYFSTVLASLEVGWEKPDSRIFEFALEMEGVSADQALHIGDNPVDDVQGAQAVGLRAILLDRTGASPGALRSLDELEEHPIWRG
jgi:HAD superfamily hydrolase (TIGR01549 family)